MENIGFKTMTREEAKKLLPIMQAYVEGKNIQFLACKDKWIDIDDPSFDGRIDYRIKPEQSTDHSRPKKSV